MLNAMFKYWLVVSTGKYIDYGNKLKKHSSLHNEKKCKINQIHLKVSLWCL